jgi:hypothetical protein
VTNIDYVADFDSASAMLRAVGRFHRGEDFEKLGMEHPLQDLIPIANRFPLRLRHEVYTWSGWGEAIPPEDLGSVRAEGFSEWAVSHYGDGPFPAVAVGSSNGAAVHLWGPLRTPWLPQTFLVPVRRRLHPDEGKADMEWGAEHGRRVLDENPDLQLHHMHDPNQDRLMIREFTYFRFKRRTLGDAYRRFIEERLAPGGTIFIVECERRWPVVTIGDRHYFQPGAMGGAEPEEYTGDSPRVAEYLERYDSHRRQWDHGTPDDEQPEAEWGFEPAIREDILALARRRGFRVRRIVFTEPEDPSPWVAEMYRAWNRRRGLASNRLIIENFIQMEPRWVLRTGSVPFWAKFSTEPNLEVMERYLDSTDPYDDIFLMLFPYGIESVGFVPIERWRELLRRARRHGDFLGVDTSKWPADFASLKRYHEDLKRKISARYPVPGGLTLGELDGFIDGLGDRYPVRVLDVDLGEGAPAESAAGAEAAVTA